VLGWRVCQKVCSDIFAFFLAFGIIITITLQAIMNIGVVCGFIPAKGVPLPFISYGGSSLFFAMLGMGIFYNVALSAERGYYRPTI
jgi:cell division protein FtsW